MSALARFRARLDAAMPKASMSVATLSLVVATSGGVAAYAATKIGTAQLKDNAVTSEKIKNGNVKTADLHKAARTKSLVWRPSAPADRNWPSSGIIKLTERQMRVSSSGLLEVNAFALATNGSYDAIIALVDYNGDINAALEGVDVTETLKLYNSLVSLTDVTSGASSLVWPRKVTKGTHTIEMYAVSNTATGGEAVSFALRLLTAEYQPGVSGVQKKWTVPLPRQAAELHRLVQ